MTFWIGVFIGFGVGSIIIAAMMLWLMGKVIHGKNETNEKLFEYWVVSVENQSEQVKQLERIADMVESRL